MGLIKRILFITLFISVSQAADDDKQKCKKKLFETKIFFESQKIYITKEHLFFYMKKISSNVCSARNTECMRRASEQSTIGIGKNSVYSGSRSVR